MKLIDEKGKLFGKLNIIDLLVILLAAAAAVLLIQRKFFRQQDSKEPGSAVSLVYQVKVDKVEPEIYETVKKYVDRSQGMSDQMYSGDNNTWIDAYVVDCAASPHVEYVNTSDGKVKRVESSGDDKRLDLVFTIEAKAADALSNKVGTQQVRVGGDHTVKTTHFEGRGTIIAVDQKTE